jgi:hypothetical protein
MIFTGPSSFLVNLLGVGKYKHFQAAKKIFFPLCSLHMRREGIYFPRKRLDFNSMQRQFTLAVSDGFILFN